MTIFTLDFYLSLRFAKLLFILFKSLSVIGNLWLRSYNSGGKRQIRFKLFHKELFDQFSQQTLHSQKYASFTS